MYDKVAQGESISKYHFILGSTLWERFSLVGSTHARTQSKHHHELHSSDE